MSRAIELMREATGQWMTAVEEMIDASLKLETVNINQMSKEQLRVMFARCLALLDLNIEVSFKGIGVFKQLTAEWEQLLRQAAEQAALAEETEV